jgi:hypothetical protein
MNWQDLEGRRVGTVYLACVSCGGREGILRRHHCQDELELYCDWCEAWTGIRVTKAEVQAWNDGSLSRHVPSMSRLCPV